MDSRIARVRRKLATAPYAALRSHSFGEEKHRFRLDPPLPDARVSEFEAEHRIELPGPYRSFLTTLGGGGASPFYGLLRLQSCRLFTMDPRQDAGSPRGFTFAGRPPHRRDLFLHIIEAGCTDLVLLGVTGPLAGRVVTGNADGSWGPDVSSATDFLAWYERWLDHMLAGRDNRGLELTSPARMTSEPRTYTGCRFSNPVSEPGHDGWYQHGHLPPTVHIVDLTRSPGCGPLLEVLGSLGAGEVLEPGEILHQLTADAVQRGYPCCHSRI